MNSDLQAAFTTSLLDCLTDYRKQVRRAGTRLSTDRVHDLRVASRRLLAAVDAVHLFLRSRKAIRIRKRIKQGLQQLGPLRDAQVQLKAAQTQLESVKGLESFVTKLRNRERRLRRDASVPIRHFRTKGLEKHIARLCRKIAASLPDTDPDHFLFTLISVADSMFAAVLVRFRALDLRNPRTFHRLRIRTKKFRYLLEFLQTTLSISQEKIEDMKRYQSALGEIQDLTVLIEAIEDFSEKQAAREPADVTRLLRMLNDTRESRMRSFLENSGKVFDFWKSVPARLRTGEPGTSGARSIVRHGSARPSRRRRSTAGSEV